MDQNIVLHLIQIIIILTMLFFIALIIKTAHKRKVNLFESFGAGAVIGFITDLGDTLGIGSFATTTGLFKILHFTKDDAKLPGTLNAVHAIPVMFEALLFITTVKIEITTLIPMTMAAILGAYVGPNLTKKWNVQLIRIALGIALVIAAAIIIYRIFFLPVIVASNGAHGLHGWLLPLGVIFNFIIGNLMTIGLGNYAPELIFFTLIGVNPTIAFPVMMLDAAMIMSISGRQFIKMDRVQWRGFAGIIIGGVIGVFVAVKIVKQLPLNILNWLIILIAVLTAFSLFKQYIKEH
ncbi:sodium:solute symporter [Periweissella fabalis]|uniref:Sodium:solute symporter n=1 Tax=Periweissella fabalis TaxID=1070421 RepID=A0A7X6S3B7_9LACO|nr:sodium:solute symporter [Periweissella fabalis]MCM0599756.1 sodium:solute symporter [Periweissella fabalis]NKZ24438.1 sodium:solute symporter [Periweissella fabalis]